MSNKYEISRSESLRSVSFAVVDCETTGVNPETDRILQVAAIIVNGEGEVVDQFDTVVRPESPESYTHGAEHIHGISKEQVENGMPLREALEKLWTISSGNVFTAHNARFDIGFLHAESERVGLSNRIETHVDTLALARKTDAEKTRRHTLDALCEHYGIEREKAHDAKADATATAELLIHLMKEMGVERSDQLPDLFA
jgi:DNA polymerase III epsilon subunit family exonuclease